jgi:ParB family chromosome partitioning protein
LKSLGRKTVSAIVKEKPSEAQLLLRQCSCDFQRQDLSAMEKASAMERLAKATNWSGKEIAAKLGVSPAMVTRLVALLTLPPEIRSALKEGRIAASAGYELAKIDDPATQAEMAERLAAGRITRDGVAGARKAAQKAANGKPPAAPKRLTAVLGAGRSVTVATAGDTLDEFIAVLEEALKKAKKGQSQGLGLDTLLRMLRDQLEAA